MKLKLPPHNLDGNCWERTYTCLHCGEGNLCDVCHKHDVPRGECDECSACPACDMIYNEMTEFDR